MMPTMKRIFWAAFVIYSTIALIIALMIKNYQP